MSNLSLDAVADRAPADSIRSRTGLPRLCAALFLGSLAVFVPQLGTTIVILPARLAVFAPDDKVALVALFAAAAAVLGFICIVLFGGLSDRTRSRYGRRNPWVLLGSLVIAAGTLALAGADSLAGLLIGYLMQSVGVAALLGALGPVIPDRVEVPRRGIASTALGAGTLIGGTIGVIISSAFAPAYSGALVALAVVPVMLGVGFMLLAPDFSGRDASRAPRVSPFAAFAFPRKAPDFYWAFGGRLLVILGYYVVGGYQLYVLTDYLHLNALDAAALLGTAAIVNLIGSVIGAVAAGPLSDLLRRRKVVTVAAAVIMGIGALILISGTDPMLFLAYTGVAGIGLGMFFSVDAALLSQVLPSGASRGKDLGLLALATNGGQVLGPLVGSVIVGAAGFAPIFVVGFLLCAAGGALLLPIRGVR